MNTTVKTFLSTISILFFSIFFVMTAFGVVVLYLLVVDRSTDSTPELKNLFNLIVPALFLLAITVSNLVTKSQLSKIDKNAKLGEKLRKYQGILLVKCAPIELAGLISAVAALVTGFVYFLAGTIAAMVLFFLIRPSINNIVNDLTLSSQEKAVFENPDAILE